MTELSSETSPTPRLVPIANGPYEVSGEISIGGPDGEPLETSAPTVYLCRCGSSANKPFCDGSHTQIGWTDDA